MGLRILGFPVRFSTTHSIDRSADFAPGKSHWILLYHPHPDSRASGDATESHLSFRRAQEETKLSSECITQLRGCAVQTADCDPCINRKIDFFFFGHSSASIPLIVSADCRRCIRLESIKGSNNDLCRILVPDNLLQSASLNKNCGYFNQNKLINMPSLLILVATLVATLPL